MFNKGYYYVEKLEKIIMKRKKRWKKDRKINCVYCMYRKKHVRRQEREYYAGI